jgi:hypothetical protein
MGPANILAEGFAATAGLHHRRRLHANMPPMHATPTLTWCCCDKAWTTKEWQIMAHAWRQGRAEQGSTGQVSVANAISIMHAAFSNAGW